jgi:hypothetical protein
MRHHLHMTATCLSLLITSQCVLRHVSVTQAGSDEQQLADTRPMCSQAWALCTDMLWLCRVVLCCSLWCVMPCCAVSCRGWSKMTTPSTSFRITQVRPS